MRCILCVRVLGTENIDEIMRDYQISRAAVEAARAYYARDKQAIDDRLAANRTY